MERAKDQRVTELDARYALYQVPQADVNTFTDATIALDRALSEFPFPDDGVTMGPRPWPDPNDESDPPPEPTTMPDRLRVRREVPSRSVDISCYQNMSPAFDRAFLTVWEFLDEILVDANQVGDEWRQEWQTSPEEFIALWSRALEP